MEVATLERGAACCGWNYCRQRLAVGAADGTVSIYDSSDSSSPPFCRSSKWKAHVTGVTKVVWLPPECGDALACIFVDGTLSLWEEVGQEAQSPAWKTCMVFDSSSYHILDIQFGVPTTNLKMVVAYSDGHVKVYELLDSLELDKWQLQAEFQNVIDSALRFGKPSCLTASVAWNPSIREGRLASFVLGFNSDLPQFNSSKIWEFEEAHQHWVTVAELALSDDKGDRVHAVAWAPNVGRPYEVIAVATCKGITIWHVGLNPEPDGRLATENVTLLSGHDCEVWQLEWDMGGMTLASTGCDGTVRLWQSNLNGIWHEQAVLDCSGVQT